MTTRDELARRTAGRGIRAALPSSVGARAPPVVRFVRRAGGHSRLSLAGLGQDSPALVGEPEQGRPRSRPCVAGGGLANQRGGPGGRSAGVRAARWCPAARRRPADGFPGLGVSPARLRLMARRLFGASRRRLRRRGPVTMFVDTNVLVAARAANAPGHRLALDRLAEVRRRGLPPFRRRIHWKRRGRMDVATRHDAARAFIAKWRASSALKDRSAAKEHFIDLCRLLGEPTPAEADPAGETCCFERAKRKDTGDDGRSATCPSNTYCNGGPQTREAGL